MNRQSHSNHYDARSHVNEPQSNLRQSYLRRFNVNNMSSDDHEMVRRPSTSNPRPGTSRKLEDIFKTDSSAPQFGDGFAQRIGWRYDDDAQGQHRTTSMHRNVERNNSQNIEDRRKWVAHSGTLGRQPLLEHALKIVEYMENDDSLMEDNPDSEQLRRDAIRDMPQSLAVKKIIKLKLMRSVGGRRKSLSCWKTTKYRISMSFLKMKTGFKDLSYTFELWYSTLKKIEGNFGSAVSTYFKFLRWLFVLNVLITLLSFGFVTVPQIIYQANDTDGYNSTAFSVADIFTGSGHFPYTILFYGFYTNGYVSGVYSMPVAYFFTMIIIYILTFIILSFSMARSYRKSFIETKGGLNNIYAHKIFCGWDYGIATLKAATLKSNSIYHELQELMSDVVSSSRRHSCRAKFITVMMQAVTNLIVLTLLGTTGFVMWILLERHRKADADADPNVNAVLMAVFINIIMLLFPIVFSFIARYEGYKTPKITLYITLFRIFLLEIMVIGILLVYWLTHSEDEECWETSIGQEIYRLVIFDFFFSVVLITLVETARYIIYTKFWVKIGVPEFDIARNALSVVYNQTLFWVGLLYSPLLGIVVVLKLFLTWYIRSAVLMKFCVQSRKSWRASQTQTWFHILTFLCLLLVLGGHGYVMINIPVSNCGPFRDYNRIHEVFSKHVLKVDDGSNFWLYASYVVSPGVVALVLIGMGMLVYYLRARSRAQINLVKFLRGRLILASKDKEFLLRHISRVTSDQWTFVHQEGRMDAIDPRKVAPGLLAQSQNSNGLSSSRPTSESNSETGLLRRNTRY